MFVIRQVKKTGPPPRPVGQLGVRVMGTDAAGPVVGQSGGPLRRTSADTWWTASSWNRLYIEWGHLTLITLVASS